MEKKEQADRGAHKSACDYWQWFINFKKPQNLAGNYGTKDETNQNNEEYR